MLGALPKLNAAGAAAGGSRAERILLRPWGWPRRATRRVPPLPAPGRPRRIRSRQTDSPSAPAQPKSPRPRRGGAAAPKGAVAPNPRLFAAAGAPNAGVASLAEVAENRLVDAGAPKGADAAGCAPEPAAEGIVGGARRRGRGAKRRRRERARLAEARARRAERGSRRRRGGTKRRRGRGAEGRRRRCGRAERRRRQAERGRWRGACAPKPDMPGAPFDEPLLPFGSPRSAAPRTICARTAACS